jgi:predicted TIM-barrel fold metal-dependent hydrolase
LKLFDAHFHIIDRRYPLVPNNGFLPEEFTCEDYLHRMKDYDLLGGAVVSGSFQAFDQTYLIAAIKQLGPSFVGVTQLPETVTNQELLRLNNEGIRGIRFNLKRGGSLGVQHLERMALRVYEVVGWHIELYVDSMDLNELYSTLMRLPSVSIDHLGLYSEGLGMVLKLAEKGVKVKASGFGRGDINIIRSLRDLYTANPRALMFGTDLPSTRASRPYTDADNALVLEALGEDRSKKVFYENALEFYRIPILV